MHAHTNTHTHTHTERGREIERERERETKQFHHNTINFQTHLFETKNIQLFMIM